MAYLVEWALDSPFSEGWSATVSLLSGGAPFHKVISSLDTGVEYYVRVSARNSFGYGAIQSSSPTYQHPYEEPTAPTGVALGVTSDTMLTVSFYPPEADGGDAVTAFVITWDVSESFTSLVGSPHSGTARVNSSERAYTVQYISTSRRYYVKVAAENSAGVGVARVASPTSAYPFQQTPGIPMGVVASTNLIGSATITWDFPLVPAHGIPCFGTEESPAICPTPVGGVYPGSDGGDDVYEYRIQWSTSLRYVPSDSTFGYVDVPNTTFTASGLTTGLRYYFRVSARNTIGYSAFCELTGNTCAGAEVSITIT